MMNALGLLEVYGLTASIEAADAMLKSAQVRLISQTITPPGLITLVIEGDLAACRAALDAGSAAASRLGKVLVRKEIGRPEGDTEWFVQSLSKKTEQEINIQKNKAPKEKPVTTQKETVVSPKVEEKPAEVKVVAEKKKATATTTTGTSTKLSETALLELIAQHPQGRNATDILSHFTNASRTDVNKLLKDAVSTGILRKRGNRYYIIEVKK